DEVRVLELVPDDSHDDPSLSAQRVLATLLLEEDPSISAVLDRTVELDEHARADDSKVRAIGASLGDDLDLRLHVEADQAHHVSGPGLPRGLVPTVRPGKGGTHVLDAGMPAEPVHGRAEI